jgi:two-component system, OmpR family, alkaline phosphatase synthesis response regulator PhoP
MSRWSILIVDDDEAICFSLKYALEKNGFEVVTIDNGLDGIRQIMEKDFDLVILDLNLGGMTGVDVLKSVNLENRNTKILIHSSYDKSFSLHKDAMRLGGHDSLPKPCSPKELLEKINSLLPTEA